jgi:hypothetical protein
MACPWFQTTSGAGPSWDAPRIKDRARCRLTVTASSTSALGEFQHVGHVATEFNHEHNLSNLGDIDTVVGSLVAYKKATFVSSEVPNKVGAIRGGRGAMYDALFFEPLANPLRKGGRRGEDDRLHGFAGQLF